MPANSYTRPGSNTNGYVDNSTGTVTASGTRNRGRNDSGSSNPFVTAKMGKYGERAKDVSDLYKRVLPYQIQGYLYDVQNRAKAAKIEKLILGAFVALASIVTAGAAGAAVAGAAIVLSGITTAGVAAIEAESISTESELDKYSVNAVAVRAEIARVLKDPNYVYTVDAGIDILETGSYPDTVAELRKKWKPIFKDAGDPLYNTGFFDLSDWKTWAVILGLGWLFLSGSKRKKRR